MEPDADILHPELVHELEVLVAGVSSQLDRDFDAGRKIVEHGRARECARAEGGASQCPRQSPLGKLSPARIEVSLPGCFLGAACFVGCGHCITPW